MKALPSTRQLRYFLALEEHGHFGHAAAACFVSQSAFSHAIQELEEILGVQLVDRTRRTVTITQTGRDVAVQARLCMQDIESLMELTAERRQPLSGPLTLGAIPTIAPFLLPRIMPKLRRKLPELKLYLREDKTETLVEELLDGSLDLILIALPWPMRGIDTFELFADKFHLAYNKNTALINPEKFTLNRLTAGSVMLLDDGHCLREHTLQACKFSSLESVNQFSASSMLTLIQMINADLGVSFLPEMAIESGVLKGTQITTRPMPGKSQRTIGLAWRNGSGREHEFKQLGELIRQLA